MQVLKLGEIHLLSCCGTTGWYSNKSGSNVAKLGPQICFQDNSVKHSGNASVRVETLSYLGTAVNGAV